MHHHAGGKERRQQIEQRDRQKGCDDQAGQKDREGVLDAKLPRLIRRSEAHGCKLEKFPAEQIAVHQKEGDQIDTRNEQQEQRHDIADDDDAEKPHGALHRSDDRHRRSGRIARIVAFFYNFSDIIEKEPGDQGRDRRNQQRHRQC